MIGPAAERRAPLAALDQLYAEADAVVVRALAAQGRERLRLGLDAVSVCRKIDLLLDAAGVAPMGAPARRRA